MLDFLRRDQPSVAAVHFPGAAQPSRDGFVRLRDLGYELIERRADDSPWALGLRHPVHGEAELLGVRDAEAIDDAIRFAANLTDDEKTTAMGSSASVGLRVPATRKQVLRDRKTMLRIARDVLGDDGVMVLDVGSQLPWSRAALDDELRHDADLDVESLYCIHNVVTDGSAAGDPEVEWQHTHGLEALGTFDLDIVAPNAAFANTDGEMLRAIATMVLNSDIGPSQATFQFGHPGGRARLVPAAEFQRSADPAVAGKRHADHHAAARSVLCEPAGRKLLGFGRGDRPEPLRFARRPPPDRFVVFFPNATTTLMAERALATVGVLRSFVDEFADIGAEAIVKLGYPTPDGSKEHLWFEAHGFGDETVDATLESRPFHVDLVAGQRADRPLGLLTDWMMMTPLGAITPRSMSAARRIRELPAEARSALAQATLGRRG